MTKYYYDDPLQAAWMAREFGVKLHPDSEWIAKRSLSDCLQLGMIGEKIKVLPESNHIFEPQDGDRSITGWVFMDGLWRFNTALDGVSATPRSNRIDRRNNKAFFMPKLISNEE